MLFDSTLRRVGAPSVRLVIVTIVVTMTLIRTLGQAAGGVVSPQDVLMLLGFAALGYMPIILSLSLFVAVVATLTRMYRNSEMVIWFASGVSLWRFLRPVSMVSWPVVLVALLLVLFVWPWVNQRAAELKYEYETRSDLSRVAAGQFQSSADGRRVLFLERDSEDVRVGRNVFVLMQNGDTESVTSAREGRIEFEADSVVLRTRPAQRGQRAQRREDARAFRELPRRGRRQDPGQHRQAAAEGAPHTQAAARSDTAQSGRVRVARRTCHRRGESGLARGRDRGDEPAPAGQLEPRARTAAVRRLLQPDQSVAGLDRDRQGRHDRHAGRRARRHWRRRASVVVVPARADASSVRAWRAQHETSGACWRRDREGHRLSRSACRCSSSSTSSRNWPRRTKPAIRRSMARSTACCSCRATCTSWRRSRS
jgi:LPS export ABC transporter permease LptF